MKYFNILFAFCVFVPAVTFGQSDRSDYKKGYGYWKAEDYPNASTTLSRYRQQIKYGQTYDVDYWLGTSWCRMKGDENAGLDMLDWAFSYSQMPQPVRKLFRTERDRCKDLIEKKSVTLSKPVVVSSGAFTSATGIAEGKLYYLAGAGNKGLNAYPLRVKKVISQEELEQRLYPLDKKDDALKAIGKSVPNYRVHSTEHLILASGAGHSAADLGIIGNNLEEYLNFLKLEYGINFPDKFITIYLVPDNEKLKELANRLHGLDASNATLGYAFQNDLSVTGILTGTGAGTILHELFHLAVRSTYGPIPQWLDEGIASLYEVSTKNEGRFYGEPNWRGRVIKEFRQIFHNITLRKVITSPWFSDEIVSDFEMQHWDHDQQAYALALARYFTLYLQERHILNKVFMAFRDRQPPSTYIPAEIQAIMLIEKTLDGSISDIEADFTRWYPAFLNPDAHIHSKR